MQQKRPFCFGQIKTGHLGLYLVSVSHIRVNIGAERGHDQARIVGHIVVTAVVGQTERVLVESVLLMLLLLLLLMHRIQAVQVGGRYYGCGRIGVCVRPAEISVRIAVVLLLLLLLLLIQVAQVAQVVEMMLTQVVIGGGRRGRGRIDLIAATATSAAATARGRGCQRRRVHHHEHLLVARLVEVVRGRIELLVQANATKNKRRMKI